MPGAHALSCKGVSAGMSPSYGQAEIGKTSGGVAGTKKVPARVYRSPGLTGADQLDELVRFLFQ